jgi:hypothetical protein
MEQWLELERKRIQAWIERIPRHIQEVIRLDGGNEGREASAKVFIKACMGSNP